MLNTTTHNIDGKEIKEYLGVVTGEAISGANFVKDFLASLKDFTGGRSGAYEEELSKARNIAFDEMNQKAREMGANGVVGIDIDYGTLGDTGSMLMVSVNGTAVKYWLCILKTLVYIMKKYLFIVFLIGVCLGQTFPPNNGNEFFVDFSNG